MNRSELVQLHLAAKKAAEETRRMLEADALAELEEQGTAGSWRHADFTMSAALKQGGPVVTDDAALLAWVRTAYPSEVETLERIRPAFLSGLLARASKIGADLGMPVDDDGTVIPGMEWRPGGAFSHVSIRPSSALRARLEAFGVAIAEGRIPFALPQEVDGA